MISIPTQNLNVYHVIDQPKTTIAVSKLENRKRKMDLIEHMENHLGEIVQGWKPNESDIYIRALLFNNTPSEGLSTYSTLGMSNYVLSIGNKKVRQELLFSTYMKDNNSNIVSMLTSFSESVIKSGKGLLRGEVISGQPLFENSKFTGLYCTNPVFWNEELWDYELSTPPTVFVWLMPLLHEEVEFIEINGWNLFEESLEQLECDYWDLHRKSCF